jgi:cold shock CspA family protein
MTQGTVKWYDAEKGYGFITADNGRDVVVYHAALPDHVDRLAPGQRVEFDILEGRRGSQASQVRVISGATQPTPAPQPGPAPRPAPAPQPITVPLLRAFNRTSGDHFYTTSAAERDNVVAKSGYVDEGVACHVFPSP